jgi:hypothetical protein
VKVYKSGNIRIKLSISSFHFLHAVTDIFLHLNVFLREEDQKKFWHASFGDEATNQKTRMPPKAKSISITSVEPSIFLASQHDYLTPELSLGIIQLKCLGMSECHRNHQLAEISPTRVWIIS